MPNEQYTDKATEVPSVIVAATDNQSTEGANSARPYNIDYSTLTRGE